MFLKEFQFPLVCAFLLALVFSMNYVSLWLGFRISHLRKKTVKVPPTIPYFIPFLGSTYNFGFNGLKFVDSSTWRVGKQAPFGVRLINANIYILQGAENLVALWKKSSSMTGTPVQLFCLKNLFGMPPNALEMYASDNSGLNAQPRPESLVAPHNRVDHRTHVSLVKFMSGKGLLGFYTRFTNLFTDHLRHLDVGEDWVEMSDFMVFFEEGFGSAATEAICGPILRRVNPKFMQDLSKYDLGIPGLSKGLPIWMIPKAYAIRDELLDNIKQWHAVARAQFTDSSVDADGDFDPYWGSGFIRSRQDMFASIDNFDYDAYAASDLGLIWATNTNIVPSSMWATLEIFRDPALLSEVRSLLKSSFDATAFSEIRFDVEKLLKLPLLQSIYSETLRLRVQAYMMRYTDREDLQINEWLFPKQNVILISTVPAHTDKTFWNTGRDNAHPVDDFWAHRFLVYPHDPSSGPCKNTPAVASPKAQPITSRAPTEASSPPLTSPAPKFSMSGTAGHWIPYGGGPRVCPGRHFANRGIVTACAIMVSMFDVEILADEKALGMNEAFYGLGGQRPIGKVPFRIRRRVEG